MSISCESGLSAEPAVSPADPYRPWAAEPPIQAPGSVFGPRWNRGVPPPQLRGNVIGLLTLLDTGVPARSALSNSALSNSALLDAPPATLRPQLAAPTAPAVTTLMTTPMTTPMTTSSISTATTDAPTSPVAPLPPGSPRVSVVIPAKNEAANLPWVFSRLPAGLHQVVLVDGWSQDTTIETARALRPDITVVQQTRRGKGNALACGFAACTGEVIVTLDADGSADPAEIAAFVEVLADGADVAKGSRHLNGGGSTDLTLLRRGGNRALAFVMNRKYGTSYSDLCYGYNAFWARCVDAFALPSSQGTQARRGDGFEIEALMTVRAVAARLTVVEVPSFELDRRHGTSNLNTWRDGWRVLRAILEPRRARARARVQTAELLPTAE